MVTLDPWLARAQVQLERHPATGWDTVAVQAVQRTLGQWQGERQALLNMEWTDDATA